MGLAETRAPSFIGFDDGHKARFVRMALGVRAVCEVAPVTSADHDELDRLHAARLRAGPEAPGHSTLATVWPPSESVKTYQFSRLPWRRA